MQDLYQKNNYFNKKDLGIREEEKKPRFNFDFILPLMVILISCFGVLIIFSATRYSLPHGATDPLYYLKRQGFWLIGSAVIFLAMQFFNYRVLYRLWWVFLVTVFLLLGSVLAFGYEVNGSKSWIDLKISSVQPSEFAKILMVVIIAAILSKWPREKVNNVSFKKVSYSLIVALVTILFILLEPDYGTAIIFFLTYMGMLFVSGANLFYFLGILLATGGGFFAAIKVGLIKQYQLDRILVFMKPDIQKQGIGYNLFQSKMAIGSGGLWGKGLFLGKQTNLNYVPEHHTDFIFSVIGEETGFLGALAILVVMAFIIWRCFYIASKSKNSFGTLIASGVGFILLSQSVINIGMTIGIMPVIGIPLPFLSYGGSNLLAIFLGMALVENVYFKRDLRSKYEIAYDEFD